MRLHTHHLPLVLSGLLVFASPLQAKKHHHNDNGATYVPPPNEAAPTVSPDALPSASLKSFLDAHLERILAPLGKEEFNQPWIVASLKSSYAAIMANAPANRKPAFAAARFVCDALTNAMAERQKAVDAWHGSSATHSSEVDQPRGGRRMGRQELGSENDFFSRSVENNWVQRAAVLRANIVMLGQRELAAENQPAADPTPASLPDSRAAAVVPR